MGVASIVSFAPNVAYDDLLAYACNPVANAGNEPNPYNGDIPLAAESPPIAVVTYSTSPCLSSWASPPAALDLACGIGDILVDITDFDLAPFVPFSFYSLKFRDDFALDAA